MLIMADLLPLFFISGPKNLLMNTIGKLFALIVWRSSSSLLLWNFSPFGSTFSTLLTRIEILSPPTYSLMLLQSASYSCHSSFSAWSKYKVTTYVFWCLACTLSLTELRLLPELSTSTRLKPFDARVMAYSMPRSSLQPETTAHDCLPYLEAKFTPDWLCITVAYPISYML